MVNLTAKHAYLKNVLNAVICMRNKISYLIVNTHSVSESVLEVPLPIRFFDIPASLHE